jgi:hypothetical protein
MRESLGVSLGESLEELLPILSSRVTMFWASLGDSNCSESNSAILGESMVELFGKRQSSGRVAGRVTNGKVSRQVMLGEKVARQVTGLFVLLLCGTTTMKFALLGKVLVVVRRCKQPGQTYASYR